MRTRRSRSRGAAAALSVLALTAGCTYADQEPGLFGRSHPTPAVSVSTAPPLPADPQRAAALPVFGDALWTSGGGQDVTLRIAVHAVRRVPGGTVLDWSVTPLSAPGLEIGDAAPASLDLGLSRLNEGNTNIFLVDAHHRRLYRPLHQPGAGCLCTPIWLVQQQLHLGRTTLLQLAFPPLPASATTIDVDVATVPVFAGVPILPVGQLPAARAVDLARAADERPPALQTTREFSYAPTGQRFTIAVESVRAWSDLTAVRWRIHSVTNGAGLDGATDPPFVGPAGERRVNYTVASGPQVVVPGRTPLSALTVTVKGSDPKAIECVCSDLRSWASALRQDDNTISVVTTYPALPTGVTRVEVQFPGLPRLEPVAVDRSSGTSAYGYVRPYRIRTWRFEPRNLPGWELSEWPTPVPDPDQLRRLPAVVERVS